MAISVTLGSITFRAASAAADADGDRFTIRDIGGWTTPPVELRSVEKPVSAGAVFVANRYTSRTVTLVGHGIASNADGIWRVRQKLATMADALVSAAATMTVAEPAGNKTLSVRLADQVRVTPTAAARVVEFTITLYAANPVKA